MDFMVALSRQILRGPTIRRLLLKALVSALAVTIVVSVQVVHNVRTIQPLAEGYDDCPLRIMSNPYLNFTGFLKPLSAYVFPLFGGAILRSCQERDNFTIDVFKVLMDNGMLDSGAKTLCVGDGSPFAVLALREMGFSDVSGVYVHPFFSLMRKHLVQELDYKDNSFDFVFSGALDRVNVPALLVSEIERVLRPGGTGAVVIGSRSFYLGGLIRSAIPVSSFLRNSNVMKVRSIGAFTLVIFKKNFDTIASFEHYRLPAKCDSLTRNKPFMKYLEPLEDDNIFDQPVITEVSYLHKFTNMSSKNRFIYLNVGAGELLNSSVENMLSPYCATKPQSLNIYVVDHNASVLTSHVKKPGVTFVYHPGLAGDADSSGVGDGDEGFDFIRWFEGAREDGDFVAFMMNAGVGQLKILFELFESGAICHVDELFIRCNDGVDCKNSMCGDCTSLFRGLRNSGVFVHPLRGA